MKISLFLAFLLTVTKAHEYNFGRFVPVSKGKKIKEQKQKSGANVRRILKDFMEFAETGFVDHEQAPPHQRTHSAAHYAKSINRKGRYGRFRHASSLPKTHALPRT